MRPIQQVANLTNIVNVGAAAPVVTAPPADASPEEHATLGILKSMQDNRKLKAKLKILDHPLSRFLYNSIAVLRKRSWLELLLGFIILVALSAALIDLKNTHPLT